MEQSSTKSPGTKQAEIVAALRREIVLGRQAPGTRLPTWDELAEQFGVSRPTLRLALGDLRTQGFVEADSTRGTFVARKPPCLHRYGLVFYESPGLGWNRFYAALAQAAAGITHAGEREVAVFYNVRAGEGSQPRGQILEDVANHRFAGLVLVGAASLMPDPLWQSMPVDRMVICKPEKCKDLSSLVLDWPSFWKKSLDWLESRGRRRVAVLGSDTSPQTGLYELAVKRGLVTKPGWHQAASLRYPEGAGHIMQLLMDPSLGEKPDAIIVTDDNLVEAALGGLLASGVRVGEQIDVVAHCCWPWPVPTMPQVKRLGFDAAEVLTVALRMVDAQRGGRREQVEERVVARFEDEVAVADSEIFEI